MIPEPETKGCTVATLAQALAQKGVLKPAGGPIHFAVPHGRFVTTPAIAFLCAYGMLHQKNGGTLTISGDPDTCRYLSRMDLHEHLGLPPVRMVRQEEAGRFLPLQLIRQPEDVRTAVNRFCDLVIARFDDAAAFVPALEWAANEVMDNFLIHAEAPVPGVVCAQFYPKLHRIEIAICDAGRGLKASLGETRSISSHGEAVTLALQRGVTRSDEVGQGNGMAGVREIALKNGGGLEVVTGNVAFRIDHRTEKGFTELPEIPGLVVHLTLDTRRPVDLGDTWIGRSLFSFVEAAARDVSEAGGFRVVDWCTHAGTRPAATPVRRRIEALLPALERPLVLDFTGINRPSSSFLDELLGRLAAGLGEAEFRRRIQFTGMDSLTQSLAGVVVSQRLGGLAGPSGVSPGASPERG